MIPITITFAQASKEEVEINSAEQGGEDPGARLHRHRCPLRLLLHAYGCHDFCDIWIWDWTWRTPWLSGGRSCTFVRLFSYFTLNISYWFNKVFRIVCNTLELLNYAVNFFIFCFCRYCRFQHVCLFKCHKLNHIIGWWWPGCDLMPVHLNAPAYSIRCNIRLKKSLSTFGSGHLWT